MRFPSRGFIIGLLLAAGLLLGLLGAWALWRGRERPGAGPARDGPTLYAAHCAGCHGPTGKGDGPGASVLRQRMRDFTDGAAMAQVNDAFLAEIIRKGGSQFGRSNAMPAWGMKLTDDEIQSLVAYIRSLAPGGPPAAPGSARSRAGRGGRPLGDAGERAASRRRDARPWESREAFSRGAITGARESVSLVSMEDYLRGCVTVEAQAPDRLRARVRFPDDLQGPPKIAHGGGVVAMLFETIRLVAGERGGAAVLPRPVRLEVVLHREVPLRVPLHGEVAMEAGVWRSRILRDGVVLAEAEVLPGAAPLVRPSAETRRAWETAQEEAFDVPAYEFCLGCGLRNPRGAQVRFEYNPGLMWKRLTPQAHFRCADGSLFPGFLLIVGDELGWWLGALRQGECGLSNRLVVSLGAPVAHGVPLLALGDRTAVVTSDPKGRIWQTRVEIVTLDWQPVAAAEVQFVGSRAFTRLMLPRFLWGEDLAAVTRAFPRYRDQVTGSSGLARP